MNERQEPAEAPGDDLDDDSLDFVLRKYHEPRNGAKAQESVLDVVASGIGEMPRVLLWDPDGDDEPIVQPQSGESFSSLHRYQIHGELARGGIGVILKGRDPDLGRDVAIKTLIERHAKNPDMVRRLVEEAQIGGQLQHPGILPVYEMGLRDDRQPYFTMKLVKGQTLAALLGERRDPAVDQRRFLSIFEQVCQTIAYAHARAVIHRDLKPANIMVGAFGEVQVMDWGLAKVLGKGGIADERKGKHWSGQTRIETVRGERPGSQSVTGSVMGTLAYMPPEQARGEVDQLDQRSDVFSLGAMLFEILTGRPPYVAESHSELRKKAANGVVSEAFACLEESGVDAELEQIVRSCLNPHKPSRPRDANIVAKEIGDHLSAVEARARAAELAAGEAKVKAVAERRARRLTLALALACLCTALLGGGGYMWMDHQQRIRAADATRAASQALEEANRSFGEARSQGGDLALLDKARALAGNAQMLADNKDVDSTIGDRVARLLADIEAQGEEARRAAAQVARNTAMVDRLDAIRGEYEIDLEMQRRDWSRRDRAYASCFADFGIDLDRMSRQEVVAEIRASGITTELAVALDDWAWARQQAEKDGDGWRGLRETARDADADPLRRSLREASLAHDAERLRALAESAELGSQPASTVVLLSRVLAEERQGEAALAVLRRGHALRPDRYEINYDLGDRLRKAARAEESIRFLSAALVSRPRGLSVWNSLGMALAATDRLDEAIAAFREVARIRPEYYLGHFNLGVALHRRGRLEEAIDACRRAIRLNRHGGAAYHVLGVALGQSGKLDEAIDALKQAIEVEPDVPGPYHRLCRVYARLNRLDEALEVHRQVIGIGPRNADTDFNLANALRKAGRLGEAEALLREAIRLRTDFAEACNNLGLVLKAKGDLDGAVEAYTRAVSMNAQLAQPHNNLGGLHLERAEWGQAAEAYTRAIHIEPSSGAYCGLGLALLRQGKPDEAVPAYSKAIRLDPKCFDAHLNLGVALARQKRWDRAIDAYDAAIRLDPDSPAVHQNLGLALREAGRMEKAIRAFREAIRLDPNLYRVRGDLGSTLGRQGRSAEAAAVFRDMIRLRPNDHVAHYNLGMTMRDQGRLDEAAAALREAVRLEPGYYQGHTHLGVQLFNQGLVDEALAAHREALRLKPDYAEAHNNLGIALEAHRDLSRARESYREAVRLEPRLFQANYNLGCMEKETGNFDEAVAAFRRAAEIRPGDTWTRRHLNDCSRMLELAPSLGTLLERGIATVAPADRVVLAKLCYIRKRYAASAALWRSALADDPKLLESGPAPSTGSKNLWRAALSAALAAREDGTDKWRRQAIVWLRGRLSRMAAGLGTTELGFRFKVVKLLKQWKRDPRLSSLRDPNKMRRLSAVERRAIRVLWTDVNDLLERASTPPK